jgi:hypothetical protein
VLPIIKSVGTDMCHVTQGGPILCEMRNPVTKLEDAVREALSMADTRNILPHRLNIISSIGLSYQSIIRKWLRPTHGSQSTGLGMECRHMNTHVSISRTPVPMDYMI